MPSLSGSSVFGRFSRRHASDSPHQGIPPDSIPPVPAVPILPSLGQTQSQPLDATFQQPQASPEAPRGRPQTGNATKRDSSILSSVSDVGHSVKRSVSLRSHRTQLSVSSGSTASKHASRVPSSGPNISSPQLTESDETATFSPSNTPPRIQRKLSRSTRTLSSKFKSAEALPSLVTNGRFATTDSHSSDSKSATSMLPGPMHIARRAPPHSQTSFSKDSTTLQPPNGASLHHSAAAAGLPAGGYNPRLVYHQIHQTSAKRMATIEYLRKVHEGNIFYFGTISHTPAQLAALPTLQPVKMVRRATNYMVLGYSLPAVLDLNSGTPLEFLKALNALLQEFETYQNLSGFDTSGSSLSRGRVGAMFSSMGLGSRAAKGRRSSAANDQASAGATNNSTDYLSLPRSAVEASSPIETSPITPTGHEFTHLLTPHLPFDPDFYTTFATLCDALIDAYGKLLDLIPSPDHCSIGVSEAFQKADKSVRKILVANVVREFEDSTRTAMKTEVAGLGRLVLGGLM